MLMKTSSRTDCKLEGLELPLGALRDIRALHLNTTSENVLYLLETKKSALFFLINEIIFHETIMNELIKLLI